MLRQYQVDAFADRPFAGNPAAVVPLDHWLDDQLMQAIAAENNLSETAFFVAEGDGFRLRWFTPVSEVDLCGHATLAAASVLFGPMGYSEGEITFLTRSGELKVAQHSDRFVMDFPAIGSASVEAMPLLAAALGHEPELILAGDDLLALFADEATVAGLKPDMALLSQLPLRGVIATAPGEASDFVSRFFAPKYGIPEDPVTGSAHCQLAPFWAEQLGKNELYARQISARGGDLWCSFSGKRVSLSGKAVLVMQGEILL